ncbi:hypothetical protein W97_02103 [Coniosporium apollinis CBS 100218]|uniref:Peptidase A2 domain-containing protein n=1 Tax=Coniosporium apollinis (strain CBS 100218) TaxID=1168221 RepID=R7YLX7_CONA1|nr:uncharacterized protein W97_02103 [Coniosporium apollinis CBS 100218]EON62878.1 hypothetical protein W97_02103 [Coniosporium apollinis CBS 100218]
MRGRNALRTPQLTSLISASGPLTDQSQQRIEIRISGHELKTLIEEPPSNDELPAYSPPTQPLPGSLSTTSAKTEAITPASERSNCFDEETREAQQSGTLVNDLHSAIEQNDLRKIKHLLQEGVDPNAQSGRLQRNALHQTALHNRAECVRLLVDNGALVDAEEGKGDTALHLATWKGHAEVVDALLTHGADIDRLSGRDGNTPLWCAISKGDSALTELFLDRGADPDIRSSTDLLPLHHAAVSGQDKLCKLLAEHGADIHCRDGEGNTPLHYAATTGQKSVISVLLHEGARHSDVQNQGLSALHWAAHKGHRDALEALLDGDAEKDLLADSATTPLHCAASRGHRACVKLLLDAGADRTICTASWDGNSGTAAELARANGHAQIASMIQFYTGLK